MADKNVSIDLSKASHGELVNIHSDILKRLAERAKLQPEQAAGRIRSPWQWSLAQRNRHVTSRVAPGRIVRDGCSAQRGRPRKNNPPLRGSSTAVGRWMGDWHLCRLSRLTVDRVPRSSTGDVSGLDRADDWVVLKIAQRCNLDCTYCYVYHRGDDSWKTRPPVISDEVVTALAGQVDEQCSKYSLARFVMNFAAGSRCS